MTGTQKNISARLSIALEGLEQLKDVVQACKDNVESGEVKEAEQDGYSEVCEIVNDWLNEVNNKLSDYFW